MTRIAPSTRVALRLGALTLAFLLLAPTLISCEHIDSSDNFDDMDQAASEVDAAAKAYRAAGLPWEAQDLKVTRNLKDADNAKFDLEKACSHLDGLKLNAVVSQVRNAIKSHDLEKADGLLRPYTRQLALTKLAASKTGIDFHIDLDKAIESPETHTIEAKALVKGLCVRAELEASRHQLPELASDITSSLRLAVLEGGRGNLINSLLCLSMQQSAALSMQRCAYTLRSDARGPTQLEDVLKSFRRLEILPTLYGEAYFGLSVVRNLQLFGGIKSISNPETAPVKIDWTNIRRTGLPQDRDSRAFAAKYLQLWASFKVAMDRFRDNPFELGKTMDKLTGKMTSGETASTEYCFLGIPPMGNFLNSVESIQAEIICEKAMLVAIKRRLSTGKLPSKIEDIPGKWIDPFSGKPLIVRRNGLNFRVYSVGPDQKDNGGLFKSDKAWKYPKPYDVGVAFEPMK